MRTLTWLYKSPLLLLVLFSLFIRWPFFFRDYIDKDESTFILMGQAWADGYLPYTFLWDLKPPLVFLFFAQIISLFGKSLISIRLIGALIVALNGFLLYLISKKHFNASLSLLLAILTVAVQSLFGSVQGVMSEHLCLAAILGGCYLTFEKKNYWLGAILFSLAFYCKMNVAYGMLPAFLYLFYTQRSSLKTILAACAVGGVLTSLLVASPYLIEGELSTYIDAVFRASLAYDDADSGASFKSFIWLSPLIVLLSLAVVKIPSLRVYTLFSLGLLVSLIKLGKINGHYLIQLYPFILLLLGTLLVKPFTQKTIWRWIVPIIALLPMESYIETIRLFNYYNQTGYLYNGEGHELARWIRQHDLQEKSAYYTEYHIAYWLTDQRPLSPIVTHPSNIERPFLFTAIRVPFKSSEEALTHLLTIQKPELIIRRSKRNYTSSMLEDQLGRALKQNYRWLETIGSAEIYELSLEEKSLID